MSLLESITGWAMEGEFLPFLWISIISLWVWLMLVLGHYAADIGADKDGDVPLTVVVPSIGKGKTFPTNKLRLQSFYKPFRYMAFCVFLGGCIGMAIAASNAG
ncbi:hypothetical protein [Ruegeria arenilitoris]|uniref:hypothetical protein n=1 Tax=Ruegeria arenilitoris TaxID=1173585 RepID=UPI003C7BCF5D